MRTAWIVIASFGFFLAVGAPKAALGSEIVPVTVCGQGLQPNPGGPAVAVIGELVADLDCSGDPASVAVNYNRAVALRLNGHRIIAGAEGVACNDGTRGRACRIEGPGEILGATTGGIVVYALQKKVEVRGVDLHDNAIGILPAPDTKTKLRDVRLRDNGSGFGLAADPPWPTNVAGRDVMLDGNVVGITAGTIKLIGFTATGHDWAAIASETPAGKVVLKQGTLAGNGLTSAAPLDGVDVYVVGRLRASAVTCNRSFGPLGSFGICAND